MTTQHTPGPWRIDHALVVGNDGDPVALITNPDGKATGDVVDWPVLAGDPPITGYDTAEANARLIAAGPDLLIALEALLAISDRYTGVGLTEIDQARAAIAAAKGESSA